MPQLDAVYAPLWKCMLLLDAVYAPLWNCMSPLDVYAPLWKCMPYFDAVNGNIEVGYANKYVYLGAYFKDDGNMSSVIE